MTLNLYDKVKDTKVSEVLVCKKTNHIYTKFINGWKIVEAQLHFIDRNKKKLSFKFNTKNVDRPIYIYVSLEDDEIAKFNYNDRGKYYLICSNFNNFETTIENVRKQIYKLENDSQGDKL